jgi:DNA primase
MTSTKKSFFEASRLIEEFRQDVDIVEYINSALEKEEDYVPFDQLLIKRLNNQAIDSPRANRYFEGRRITRESIEKFSLGYSESQDMITVPMNDPTGSFFVGFVARSVEGKDFKNTPGLPKSKILFNLHRAKLSSTVYVVESSFDAVRLDQCGVPAVATLGANVSKKQINLLTKYFNHVIVIPDNDDAGKSMAANIVKSIGKRATTIGLPERFKDIGDMSDSDIKELVNKVNDPLFAIY